MELSQDRAEGYFFIRAVREQSVFVIDRELVSSFLIAPDKVVEDWPVRAIGELDPTAVQAIAALEPELVILGSGPEQQFPQQTLLLPFLRQGIGVEVMQNSAAGRTYNLLAGEGRKVVAAFILPG
ncbi:MAG TPA: MTH938/NDUFAF3 family protein [Dokdonella sp.]|uniref:Mth938-like domain-containing protein n=1 Tax=Dokdonella sp. TaxID=2291710 RepID=UPI002D7E6338|nr:MTH938/NDUFAF3 family protein [Dokdonella sp.]HET9032987.1 MTH938/NDUFAF3 family protein [Dokdonella sp.]